MRRTALALAVLLVQLASFAHGASPALRCEESAARALRACVTSVAKQARRC
jgi:hypothetical protein